MDGPSFELELSSTPEEKFVKDEVTKQEEKVDNEKIPPMKAEVSKEPLCRAQKVARRQVS